MKRLAIFPAVLILLCAANQGKADLVTLVPVTGYPTGANANALAGPLLSSDFHSVTIPGPGPGVAIASKLGNFATHDFSVKLDYSTSPAFFDSSYMGAFSRTSTLGHRASAESIFHFTVDVPTVFDVSGFFGSMDAMGTTIPGNIELEIELLEFDSFAPMSPPPSVKFYTYQVSHMTLDELFVVAGAGGDSINSLIGTPFGMLDPLKYYRYRTLVTINSIDPDGAGPMLPTNGAASAFGAHMIRFSAAVPEPSSTALLAMFALCLVRRRSRIQSESNGKKHATAKGIAL